MQYIIFDLEWNQPHSDGAMITEPVYLTGEIIEIGAVKLNEHFTPVDELRLYITPKHYTKMHRRIAALTGIHDRQLQEQGIPFPEAFAKFTDWCGEDYAYMTWSLSDMPMLLDNMLCMVWIFPICHYAMTFSGFSTVKLCVRVVGTLWTRLWKFWVSVGTLPTMPFTMPETLPRFATIWIWKPI